MVLLDTSPAVRVKSDASGFMSARIAIVTEVLPVKGARIAKRSLAEYTSAKLSPLEDSSWRAGKRTPIVCPGRKTRVLLE